MKINNYQFSDSLKCKPGNCIYLNKIINRKKYLNNYFKFLYFYI